MRAGLVAGAAGARCPFPGGSTCEHLCHKGVSQGDACGAASSLSSASDFCVGVFNTGSSPDLVDPERRSIFSKCFTIGCRGWGPTDAIIFPKLSKSSLTDSLFAFSLFSWGLWIKWSKTASPCLWSQSQPLRSESPAEIRWGSLLSGPESCVQELARPPGFGPVNLPELTQTFKLQKEVPKATSTLREQRSA